MNGWHIPYHVRHRLSYLVGLVFWFGLCYLVADWLIPYDDTDPPGKRSGLIVYTDHASGCQYLARFVGGVTPRMTADGKHAGCKRTT